jgi:hypothetical protein
MLLGGLSSLGVAVLLGSCAMVSFSSARSSLSIGEIPSYPVKEYILGTLNSPLVVWVPEDETWCLGNAPLPCVPEALISNRLMLRQAGFLGKGFKWDPRDYEKNTTRELQNRDTP